MNRPGRATLAILGAVITLGGQGCRREDAALGRQTAAMVVRRGTLEDRFALTGELEATTSETLRAPRTPNWSVTIRWLIDDGAVVKKGDRLIEFDAEAFSSALTEKRQAVQSAETNLAGQDAADALVAADKKVEVERKRVAAQKARANASVPQDLRSRRDFQEKQKALAVAGDDLGKAESDLAAQGHTASLDRRIKDVALARARRELKDIESRLDSLVLTAPRDGLAQIAVNWQGRKYQVGDTAYGGLAVVAMPDLSLMQVRARLTDVDEGAVRAGMKAECVLDSYPDHRLAATLVSISPVAHPDARESIRKVFDVLVALPDQGPDPMLPGMSVRVEVIRRRADHALVVPRTALRTVAGKTFARLASGRDEPVELEFCAPQECVVAKGPPEGTALAAPVMKPGRSS